MADQAANGLGWWRKAAVILCVISAVLVVYAGAPAVGVTLWRPASIGEHKMLSVEVSENTAARLKRHVDDAQNDAWVIEDRIKKAGETADLVKRYREYIRQRDEAADRLRRYKDKKK